MKIKFFLIFLVVVVFAIFQIFQFLISKTQLIFCNVGEGDGVILIHKTTVFLIDAGRDSRIRKCLERHLPFWQTEITGIILTHPDADHMAGIKSVMKRYSVKYFFSDFVSIETKRKNEMQTEYDQIIDTLRNSGVVFKSFASKEGIVISSRGKNGISIISLWPNEIHVEGERNNLYSNISVITIGSDSFLMLADSEISTQVDLLPEMMQNCHPERDQASSASCYVAIKVSHHGSVKNFSLTLMRELLPQYAIFSVGSNKYGHPGKRVLDGINSLKINILRTDKLGDVVFECEEKCVLHN